MVSCWNQAISGSRFVLPITKWNVVGTPNCFNISGKNSLKVTGNPCNRVMETLCDGVLTISKLKH